LSELTALEGEVTLLIIEREISEVHIAIHCQRISEEEKRENVFDAVNPFPAKGFPIDE